MKATYTWIVACPRCKATSLEMLNKRTYLMRCRKCDKRFKA